MESKKRERSANFNMAEIQVLLNIVEKFKLIIENKKTNAVTNKAKDTAWKEIEYSFNSCGPSTNFRSWKTLKLKYEGLKKMTKKKSLRRKQDMYKTGGEGAYNDVEEKLLNSYSKFKGIETRHDNDTISSPTVSEEVILDTTKISFTDTAKYKNVTENTTKAYMKIPENKSKKCHPMALKTQVSNALKTDTVTKVGVTSTLDKLSLASLELVQLQMETARKQQQYLEDEHKLKMIHIAMTKDEKRKKEVHELLARKLCSGVVSNDMIL